MGTPRRARAPRRRRGTTPWSLPLDERDIRDLTGYAHTACLLLAAALTGMRESELMELRHGCRSTSHHGDGITRYRLRSKLVKGQPLGGTSEEWVVIKAVHDAIGMAEQLSRFTGVPGDLVFGRFSFDLRYPWFRDWVNGPAGQRLGLTPIPDGTVNPRTSHHRPPRRPRPVKIQLLTAHAAPGPWAQQKLACARVAKSYRSGCRRSDYRAPKAPGHPGPARRRMADNRPLDRELAVSDSSFWAADWLRDRT